MKKPKMGRPIHMIKWASRPAAPKRTAATHLITSIDEELRQARNTVEALAAAREILLGEAEPARRSRTGRRLSAAGRKKIAAAMKARWALARAKGQTSLRAPASKSRKVILLRRAS